MVQSPFDLQLQTSHHQSQSLAKFLDHMQNLHECIIHLTIDLKWDRVAVYFAPPTNYAQFWVIPSMIVVSLADNWLVSLYPAACNSITLEMTWIHGVAGGVHMSHCLQASQLCCWAYACYLPTA